MNEIDRYISSFPEETQVILKNIRHQIKSIAPKVDEILTYVSRRVE